MPWSLVVEATANIFTLSRSPADCRGVSFLMSQVIKACPKLSSFQQFPTFYTRSSALTRDLQGGIEQHCIVIDLQP